MTTEQSSDQKKLQLTFRQKLSILLSFAKDKVAEQIQCVWFIILYLIVFQILILGLPIVYSPDDRCRDYHCNHRLGLFYGGFAIGFDALG